MPSLTQAVLIAKLQHFLYSIGAEDFAESIKMPYFDLARVRLSLTSKRNNICNSSNEIAYGYSCQPKTSRSGNPVEYSSKVPAKAQFYAEWLLQSVRTDADFADRLYVRDTKGRFARVGNKSTGVSTGKTKRPDQGQNIRKTIYQEAKALAQKDINAGKGSATAKAWEIELAQQLEELQDKPNSKPKSLIEMARYLREIRADAVRKTGPLMTVNIARYGRKPLTGDTLEQAKASLRVASKMVGIVSRIANKAIDKIPPQKRFENVKLRRPNSPDIPRFKKRSQT